MTKEEVLIELSFFGNITDQIEEIYSDGHLKYYRLIFNPKTKFGLKVVHEKTVSEEDDGVWDYLYTQLYREILRYGYAYFIDTRMGVNETTTSKPDIMTPTHIVVHHSASTRDEPIATIREWHLDHGWRDVGYHYHIRKSGEIEVGRMEHIQGAHARGMNNKSLGICVSGDFTKEAPTEEQITNLARLILSITKRYDIPLHNVIGHEDVVPTLCPAFSLDPIKNSIDPEWKNKQNATS